jgi:hypothetical protein
MRPLGELAQALLNHAAAPGTVRQLCERAQVGYGPGRYTASRLLAAGQLRAVDAVQGSGPGRPAAVVQAAAVRTAPAPAAADAEPWNRLHQCMFL